jgi:hypothetical protein
MSLARMLTALLLFALPACTATIGSRNTVSCSYSSYPDPSDTCQSFADAWAITVEKLVALNPSIDCAKFETDGRYCVFGTVSPDPTTASSIEATSLMTVTNESPPAITQSKHTDSTTSTFTTTPVVQHQPQQSGLAADCNAFYQISGGDSCGSVTSRYGVTWSQFVTWNPSINSGKCLISALRTAISPCLTLQNQLAAICGRAIMSASAYPARTHRHRLARLAHPTACPPRHQYNLASSLTALPSTKSTLVILVPTSPVKPASASPTSTPGIPQSVRHAAPCGQTTTSVSKISVGKVALPLLCLVMASQPPHRRNQEW